MILVDTNVISELTKVAPNPVVTAYLDRQPPDAVFTAAICEAEIRYGLGRMPRGHRRDELIARMDMFFEACFQDQVLRFDSACATLYGEIRSAREATGRPITVEDAMIAATARVYGVQVIATRNTKDFQGCGVTLIDPWLSP
jgi:predicted nucleic acid-binding protein